MPRTKYQNPKIYRSGRRPQVWRADWYTYDSANKRKHRTGTFGPTSTTSRAAAQQACNERVQVETSQTPPKSAPITLSQLLTDVYLPSRVRWSRNTRMNIQSCIRHYIEPALGSLPIVAINKITLQKHLIALADAGVGATNIERVCWILHAALEEAVENDYIPKNPARKIEIPDCRPHEETRPLTEAEVTRLFGCLSGEDRLFFRIMILTGARLGEALALKRDDVTPGNLRIDQAAVGYAIGPTKTRRVRTIEIPRALEIEIRHWLGLRLDSSPFLFPSVKGGVRHRNHWPAGLLRRARKAASIPDLNFRMCRTTTATLLDADISDVQAILGHSRAVMTLQHYRKSVPERQREAVEKLEGKLQ